MCGRVLEVVEQLVKASIKSMKYGLLSGGTSLPQALYRIKALSGESYSA
jgi:hypothetical protein